MSFFDGMDSSSVFLVILGTLAAVFWEYFSDKAWGQAALGEGAAEL